MLGSPAQPPAFSEALQSRLYLKDEEMEAQTLTGSDRVTGRDEDPQRADGTHALPMAPGWGGVCGQVIVRAAPFIHR